MRSILAAFRSAFLLGGAILIAALPVRAQAPPSSMASWRWHTLTPDSLVGRAFHTAAVAYDGTRRVVYAAGDFTGLIRSDDSGRSWRFLPTPFRIQHFAVAPRHPDVLYAVTSNRTHVHEGYAYPGVFASRDGGQTWTNRTGALYASGYPVGLWFNRVEVSPTDTAHVFVTGSWNVGSIAFSKDGGRSWRGYDFGGGSHGGGMNAVPSQRVAGRVWGATMHSGTAYYTSLVQFDGWGDVITKRSYLNLDFGRSPSWWQIDKDEYVYGRSIVINTSDLSYYRAGLYFMESISVSSDIVFGTMLKTDRLVPCVGFDKATTCIEIDPWPVDGGIGDYPNHYYDGRDSVLYYVSRGIYAYGRSNLLATASGEDGGTPSPLALSVYPNPARGPVTLAVEGVTTSSAQAQVYDVTGREVARLAFDVSGRAVWDGRDASGAALPSGVYLVRAVQGNHSRTAYVMLQR